MRACTALAVSVVGIIFTACNTEFSSAPNAAQKKLSSAQSDVASAPNEDKVPDAAVTTTPRTLSNTTGPAPQNSAEQRSPIFILKLPSGATASSAPPVSAPPVPPVQLTWMPVGDLNERDLLAEPTCDGPENPYGSACPARGMRCKSSYKTFCDSNPEISTVPSTSSSPKGGQGSITLINHTNCHALFACTDRRIENVWFPQRKRFEGVNFIPPGWEQCPTTPMTGKECPGVGRTCFKRGEYGNAFEFMCLPVGKPGQLTWRLSHFTEFYTVGFCANRDAAAYAGGDPCGAKDALCRTILAGGFVEHERQTYRCTH